MKNTKSRVLMLALLILSTVVLLAACAPKPAAPTASPTATAVVTAVPAATAVVTDVPAATAAVTDAPAAESILPVFTAGELAKYDGLDGRKAYVAFEGTVYDVTNDPQWKSGGHGGNKAGTDITANLKAAAHGTSKLNGLPVAGTYSAP